MTWFTDPGIWIALLQILAIDILLGGDNAVVIAMACRRLPEQKRKQAIWGGMLGAILVRIVLLFFAMQLLALPWLKLLGALLLLWVGIKLIGAGDDDDEVDGGVRLWTAIRTIVIADVVMSLDNVIAVAAAGQGNLWLVSAGVLISIPLIVLGSRLVLALMDRFPSVVLLGGALIGWIAGGMGVADPALHRWLPPIQPWMHYLASAAGAALVLAIGLGMARWRDRQLKNAAH
ncbi:MULTISPECIES: TerC family protein [unclassified Pseudomonas]|uniref:TerC family protein n=1 Tax=unclassified Pseudomonas TaxID=196821 RepID=UPI000BD998F8|nr:MULTISPECIES: TerC family protein [unclassified Pseudomonas]PVZ15916.1 YjbE family integral membrane protein [Pseudomonas sp. URIL14HWK12:I12]PVZ26228.1 YjbE family integral membrane protein [Pseudomonas sp. URIL14HWK12:I10]PVZ36248.1 YjbE family integral membrane protein [Pseudomonas sp. URIL14HWK12:I11]SNZ18236.1 integral membrane protein, YjbE family [Pseudomonas sp. URIL14HWK12:I9]